jgi:transcriptional regulator with XRE-family HTH domain
VRPIKRIKLERQSLQVSQQAVEAVSGVPQPVISLAENGRLVPTPEQLRRLADVFKVHPDDLLRDVVVLEPRR